MKIGVDGGQNNSSSSFISSSFGCLSLLMLCSEVQMLLCRKLLRFPRVSCVLERLNIPFIDIFIINTISDHYEVLEGVKDLFPGETLPFRCFERLIDVPFGHLTLRGMNATDAQRHFDENFGIDWSRVAWRIFDHVTGEEFPKVCINLDQPDLLRPVLHSRYIEMKSPLIPSSLVSNGVENHSTNR